jgi:hypothetical protein
MEPMGAHRALSTAVKSSDRKSGGEGEMLTGLVGEVPGVTLVLAVDEMEPDTAGGSLPLAKWICSGSASSACSPGVRLPTSSAVGWASLTVTARPEGRWRLLMSHRGVVHRWGPHGGGG